MMMSFRFASASRSRACTLSLFSLLASFLVLPTVVHSTDVYVDDNDDSLSYSPSNSWAEGNGCSSCALQPDSSQTYGSSWHDTTYYASGTARTISLSFTGVAVAAYFIVPDKSQGDATVGTDLVFTLDGAQAGTYTHSPSGASDFLYKQQLFSTSGLSNDAHTLVVSASASDGGSTAVLFDYFVYTTDDDTSTVATPPISSSSSSTKSSSQSSSTRGSSSTGTESSSSSSSSFLSSAGASTVRGLSSGISSSTSTSGTSGDGPSSISSNAASPTQSSNDDTASAASSSTGPGSSHANVGAIVGGVIGGVLGLLLFLLLLLCYRRRTIQRGSSWFGNDPHASLVTPHPVVFDEEAVRRSHSRSNSVQNEYGEKVRTRDRKDRPAGATETVTDRRESPTQGTTNELAASPTVNATEILNQVAAIQAVVMSMHERTMAPTVAPPAYERVM